MAQQYNILTKPNLYRNGPNNNIAYGPWDSPEIAEENLRHYYKYLDTTTLTEVVDIPVGTTVGVFADDSKTLILEYWWVGVDEDGHLCLKTYGNNYYDLQFVNQNSVEISKLELSDDGNNPPYIKINKIDSTSDSDEEPDGYVKYFIDGTEYTYTSGEAISTVTITKSFEAIWYDEKDNVLTTKTLKIEPLSYLLLTYYAYNTSTANAPDLISYENVDLASYQLRIWNVTGWSTTRTGFTSDLPIEWSFTRERIDNVWQEFTTPQISAQRGIDGVSVYNKLFIYAAVSYNDDTTLKTLQNDIEALRNKNDLTDDKLSTPYISAGEIIVGETRSQNTWYSKFPGTSATNKYIFVSERSKSGVGSPYGYWSDPELLYSFSCDGKDGANIEYIYNRISKEAAENLTTIKESIKSELETINTACATAEDGSVTGMSFNDYIELNSIVTSWTDHPLGVSDDYPIEFYVYRDITTASDYSKVFGIFLGGDDGYPLIWATMGKEGPDGDGIEYIYLVTSTNETPTILLDGDEWNINDFANNGKLFTDDEYLPYTDSTATVSWTDDPQKVDHAHPYQWMSKRKGSQDSWGKFSTPILWNQFSVSYELFLDNDTTLIPASETGVYSPDAAKNATKTTVTLKLGSEIIDYLNNDEITISCDGYLNDDYVWYLNDTESSIKETTLKTFTATDSSGNILALKSQTISLNKTGVSYKLVILPNSRLWYGGVTYSATDFPIKVYSYSSMGVMSRVEDLSAFLIKYQFSDANIDGTLEHSIKLATSILSITNGNASDIFVLLCDTSGNILDSETIDGIDYSDIKGRDADTITISLDKEDPEIPFINRANVALVKANSVVKIRAYHTTTSWAIKTITAAIAYLDGTPTTGLNLYASANDTGVGEVYLELAEGNEVKGDILVSLSIIVNDPSDTSKELTFDKSYVIALDSVDETPYSLEIYPDILSISTGDKTFDDDDLSIEVRNLETGSLLDRDAYTINYKFGDEEGTIDSSRVWESNNGVIRSEGINFFAKYCSKTSKNSFLFTVKIDNDIKYKTVPVLYKYQEADYTYNVSLSNEYTLIQKNCTDLNIISQLLLTDIIVYQGATKVPEKASKVSGGPYYELSSITYDNGSTDVLAYNKDTKVYSIPVDTLTTYLLKYTIKVYENDNEDTTPLEFYKSLTVGIVDSAIYKLVLRPTTVVALANQSGTLNVTPEIIKYDNTNVTTIEYSESNLSKEGLSLSIPESTYSETETSAEYTLYKTLSDGTQTEVDHLSVSIVRNGQRGADGSLIEYIFGMVETLNLKSDLIQNIFKLSLITTKTKTSLSLPYEEKITVGGESYTIKWTGDPSGVSETNILEYKSTSRNSGTEWSNFTTPVIESAFGLTGKDGTTVEYIYLACARQLHFKDTDSCDTSIYEYTGDTLNDTATEISEVYPTSSALYNGNDPTLDEYVPQYWSDEIPDLNAKNSKLYMSYRKKVNDVWKPFSSPQSWNSYDSHYSFSTTNDNIIVDDDTTSDDFVIASITEFNIGIDGVNYTISNDSTKTKLENNTITTTLIDEDLHIGPTATIEISMDEGLTVNGTNALIPLLVDTKLKYSYHSDFLHLAGTKGEINYTLTIGDTSITKSQKVLIYDFSSGDVYKLNVTPNVISASTSEDKFAYAKTEIAISILAINNKSESPITKISEGFKLIINGESLTNYDSDKSAFIYILPANSSSNADNFTVKYIKTINDVDVILDSETVSFSKQGLTGDGTNQAKQYSVEVSTNNIIYSEKDGVFSYPSDFWVLGHVWPNGYVTQKYTITTNGCTTTGSDTSPYFLKFVKPNTTSSGDILNDDNIINIKTGSGNNCTTLNLMRYYYPSLFRVALVETITNEDESTLNVVKATTDVKFVSGDISYEIKAYDTNNEEITSLDKKYSYGHMVYDPSTITLKTFSTSGANTFTVNDVKYYIYYYASHSDNYIGDAVEITSDSETKSITLSSKLFGNGMPTKIIIVAKNSTSDELYCLKTIYYNGAVSIVNPNLLSGTSNLAYSSVYGISSLQSEYLSNGNIAYLLQGTKTTDSDAGSTQGYYFDIPSNTLKPNTIYTASLLCKQLLANGFMGFNVVLGKGENLTYIDSSVVNSVYNNTSAGIYINNSEGIPTMVEATATPSIIDSEYKLLSLTFKTSDYYIDNNPKIFVHTNGFDSKYYFSSLKLEESEVATPWCLSTSDSIGTSPIVCDLDNEMDSIPANEFGIPNTDSDTVHTTISLSKGTEELTIQKYEVGGIDITSTNASSPYTFSSSTDYYGITVWKINNTIYFKETLAADIKVSIPITVTDTNGNVGSATFTINKIIGAAVYKIIPSASQITYGKSSTLTCSISKSADGKTSAISSGSNGVYLFYKKSTDASYLAYTEELSIESNPTYTYILFVLSTVSTASNITNNDILDKETISVIKNGADGDLSNLFGYANILSSGIHTNSGFAEHLVYVSKNDSEELSEYYTAINILGEDNSTNWLKSGDIISISCDVLLIKTTTDYSGLKIMCRCWEISKSEGSYIQTGASTGNTYHLESKLTILSDTYPFLTIGGFQEKTINLIVSVKNLKIEYADNLVGISTPYNGLASDSIPCGLNLLLNSADFSYNWTYNGNILANQYLGCSALYYVGTDSGTYIDLLQLDITGKLKANTWYTFSYYSKTTGTYQSNIYISGNSSLTSLNGSGFVVCDLDGLNYIGTSFPNCSHLSNTNWTLHTMTFKTPSSLDSTNIYAKITVAQDENISSNNFYITMPKLEEGDKPTVWQLNENDRKGEKGSDGNSGVTVRSFKQSFDAGLVYRNDSSISVKEKYVYDNGAWKVATSATGLDTNLYYDYFAIADTSSGSVIWRPFVCKNTYRHTDDSTKLSEINTALSTFAFNSDGVLTTNVSELEVGIKIDKNGNTSTAFFSEVWELANNLGNGFFTSLNALSGNIDFLSSSVLKVNGLMLMYDNSTDTPKIIAGINGEGFLENNTNTDRNGVSDDIVFWAGGTGAKDSEGNVNANFYVTKNGILHAVDGHFSGMVEPILYTLNTLRDGGMATSLDPLCLGTCSYDMNKLTNKEALMDYYNYYISADEGVPSEGVYESDIKKSFFPLNFEALKDDNIINLRFPLTEILGSTYNSEEIIFNNLSESDHVGFNSNVSYNDSKNNSVSVGFDIYSYSLRLPHGMTPVNSQETSASGPFYHLWADSDVYSDTSDYHENLSTQYEYINLFYNISNTDNYFTYYYNDAKKYLYHEIKITNSTDSNMYIYGIIDNDVITTNSTITNELLKYDSTYTRSYTTQKDSATWINDLDNTIPYRYIHDTYNDFCYILAPGMSVYLECIPISFYSKGEYNTKTKFINLKESGTFIGWKIISEYTLSETSSVTFSEKSTDSSVILS